MRRGNHARRRESSVPDHAAQLRHRAHLALYVAAATVAFVVERSIPSPLPWVRLGLANGVILLVLYRHGAGAALWVQLGRIVLGSLFAGTFLGPSFLLAVAGGCSSWMIMAGVRRFLASWFSLLGISVLGATAHVLAQLALAAWVFRAGSGIFTLVPVFLVLGLVTGTCIGIMTQALLGRLHAVPAAGGP
jgi:heptaprenyl diphosphate synthase